jgi:hypothetical protein
VGAGSAFSSLSTLPGGKGCAGWGWTCNASASLNSITLATTGGVSSIQYQATNQIKATCGYSDGTSTDCTTTDSHGNAASDWASSSGAVTLSASGLATGAVIGSAVLTAKAGGLTSPGLTLAVTSQKNLTGVTLNSTAKTMAVGGTLQFHAFCAYANAATQDCSVTDVYGDAVTAWGSSATGVMTMSSSGLATGKAAGSANATAMVNGSVNATPLGVTVTAPIVSLTGITLSSTGGVTGLFVGSTNQLKATCSYSDGTTTNCTTMDSHGNQAGTWVSATPSHATVSGSGLVTGLSPGATSLTAKAGNFTSPALPLTVITLPSGVFTITVSGPVKFSGTVKF